MAEWTKRRYSSGSGPIPEILLSVLSVGSAFTGVSVYLVAGDTGAVVMTTTPAMLIVAGLGLGLRSPLFGGVMALIGAVGFALLMVWTVVAPVLAALAVFLWVTRYRSSQRTSLSAL